MQALVVCALNGRVLPASTAWLVRGQAMQGAAATDHARQPGP